MTAPQPQLRIEASRVAPKLYVGSKPDPGRYPMFSAIVLCAQEYQPEGHLFPGSAVIHAPLDDDPTRPMYMFEKATAFSASRVVAHYLSNGRRVLVTCAMGLNRSSLVAALAIKQVYQMAPDDIIAMIRATRDPGALCNPNFRRLIKYGD